MGVTRRNVVLGTLAGLAGGLVAGCGAGGTTAPTAAGTASGGAAGTTPAAGGTARPAANVSGKIVWQIRDQPEYADLSKWAVDQFKTKFPNVTVEASPNNVGNSEKTIAQMVSGSGPDVFQG